MRERALLIGARLRSTELREGNDSDCTTADFARGWSDLVVLQDAGDPRRHGLDGLDRYVGRLEALHGLPPHVGGAGAGGEDLADARVLMADRGGDLADDPGVLLDDAGQLPHVVAGGPDLRE